jgi:hypothetical protein
MQSNRLFIRLHGGPEPRIRWSSVADGARRFLLISGLSCRPGEYNDGTAEVEAVPASECGTEKALYVHYALLAFEFQLIASAFAMCHVLQYWASQPAVLMDKVTV